MIKIHLRSVKRNIRRTPYQAIAVTMVMFLAFFVLSLFTIAVVISELELRDLENRPEALAFLKDTATEEDVQKIHEALKQSNKLASFRYISQEEAFKEYQEENKHDPLLVELVNAQMLPASITFSATYPQYLGELVEIVKKEPVIGDISFPQEVTDSIFKTTQLVRFSGLMLVLFLLVFAILIVILVVGFKIRLKKVEIDTMKLLGASSWFVKIPFLLEGLTYGVAGAILAWLATLFMVLSIQQVIQKELAYLNLPSEPVVILMFMLILLTGELLIASIISLIGSYGAIRRYLKI